MLTVIACKKPGCTDPIAINYNSQANKDDGSCEYQIDKSIISQNITSDKTLSNDTSCFSPSLLTTKIALEDIEDSESDNIFF